MIVPLTCRSVDHAHCLQQATTVRKHFSGIRLDYLGRLVRAFEQPAAPATSPGSPRARPSAAVAPGLVEALTDRELQVLRLLAAGKENQAIARELVVAVSTVKKHVTHILEKLGAANRTEATARAREFGLLFGPAE
jgi:LuxR family maltose regulon positive regulatory protein